MRRTSTIGLAGLALFAVSGASQADTIDMHFSASGIVLGANVTIHHSSLMDGSQQTVAGRFDWTVNSPDGTLYGGQVFNNGDQFSTYCSEITEDVDPGGDYVFTHTAIADMPRTHPAGSTMGTFRAGLLQELFDNHFTESINGNSFDDFIEAAAFQVAMWEIIYEADIDGVDDLGVLGVGDGDGAFYMTEFDLVVTQANEWLGELLGNQAVTNLLGFANDGESHGAQDHIGVMVPLPAPIWLAGMGLLGVVFGRNRLRRLATG